MRPEGRTPIARLILLVDDDVGVRTLLADMLEMLDHQVEMANTGEEALTLLASRSYDVVLPTSSCLAWTVLSSIVGLTSSGRISRAEWRSSPAEHQTTSGSDQGTRQFRFSVSPSVSRASRPPLRRS